ESAAAKPSAGTEPRRVEAMVQRARIARDLATASKSAQNIALLENQVWQRSVHPDWRYHGLDGALAVRSLAQLRSIKSVPLLIASFERLDPALSEFKDGQWSEYPLAWRDQHFKMTLIP